MGCTTNTLYKSTNWCKGVPVLPGIRRRVYFMPKSDIVAWPTLPTMQDKVAPADPTNLVTLSGDFVPAADKKFRFIDVETTESPVTWESQGDAPYSTFLNKATFKHPGTGAEASAFAAQANNDDLIYLFQEKSGKFRVIGNEMFDTKTTPKGELGAADTDKAGTTLEVQTTATTPPPFYVGKIETESGDISGLDGSAVAEGAGA